MNNLMKDQLKMRVRIRIELTVFVSKRFHSESNFIQK